MAAIRSPVRSPSRTAKFSPTEWKFGSLAQVIRLSNAEVEDDAVVGDLVGELSVTNGTGTYTFTITADPSAKFAIDVTRLELAALVTAGNTYSVTVTADNGVDTPLERTFIVTAVEPNLAPLTLDQLFLNNLDLDENSAAGTLVGTLTGRTIGSTLSLIGSAGERFAIDADRIEAGMVLTDYSSAASHTITVRETLAGATNSPRDTNFTITVNNVAPVLSNLAVTPVGPGYTTATIAIDTTDGDGNIFFVVVPTASPVPSNPQIVSGLDGNGTAATWASGEIAVAGIDTFATGVTGLTASATYDCYALHFDASNQASNVATVEFLAGSSDITAPTISSSSPSDNATSVAVADNITITFSESVLFNYPGGGTLSVKVVGGATVETFTPSSTTAASGDNGGSASISAAVLTINPGASLANSTEYAVRIAADCLEDASANAFAGIANDTTLSFTTAAAATPERQYMMTGRIPVLINDGTAGREAMHITTYLNGA